MGLIEPQKAFRDELSSLHALFVGETRQLLLIFSVGCFRRDSSQRPDSRQPNRKPLAPPRSLILIYSTAFYRAPFAGAAVNAVASRNKIRAKAQSNQKP